MDKFLDYFTWSESQDIMDKFDLKNIRKVVMEVSEKLSSPSDVAKYFESFNLETNDVHTFLKEFVEIVGAPDVNEQLSLTMFAIGLEVGRQSLKVNQTEGFFNN